MGNRLRHNTPGAGPADVPGPGGENLDSMRERSERAAAAGDAAIDRCISRNSEDYLEASRQHGGQ